MSAVPVRDAAALILIERSEGCPRILMGRRRPDQVFLPNVFVFPGGRVDEADVVAPSADDLSPSEAALLAIPHEDDATGYGAGRVRALAMAAVRETFEETGVLIGARADTQTIAAPGAWRTFVGQGVLPRLSRLRYFMRAITPKLRPRRYDTRFFLADAREIAARTHATDEELSEIGWYDFNTLQSLEVPRMTRLVLMELERLEVTRLEPPETRRVPFIFERGETSVRVELSLASPSS